MLGTDTSKWKILQLIPAPDWVAVFRTEDKARESRERLTAWALVEIEPGHTSMAGLIPVHDVNGLCDFACGDMDFLRYEHKAISVTNYDPHPQDTI